MYASRGTGVNIVFTTPTPTLWQPSADGVNAISWSPDGRSFADDYQGRIYVFDLSGKPARVIGFGSNPSWSPDGHWIAFRSADGMAYAVDPTTQRGQYLFGRRRTFSGVHWAPDSRYVMLSERLGLLSNLLYFRNPLLTGIKLVIRVADSESTPIGWIGSESPDDHGFDWISDYHAFLKRAAVRPIVPGCQ
jgi:WD40 repeat protein